MPPRVANRANRTLEQSHGRTGLAPPFRTRTAGVFPVALHVVCQRASVCSLARFVKRRLLRSPNVDARAEATITALSTLVEHTTADCMGEGGRCFDRAHHDRVRKLVLSRGACPPFTRKEKMQSCGLMPHGPRSAISPVGWLIDWTRLVCAWSTRARFCCSHTNPKRFVGTREGQLFTSVMSSHSTALLTWTLWH